MITYDYSLVVCLVVVLTMSSHSDSDSCRQSVISTQRSRIHRARVAQGSVIRHPATTEERVALLNTPYAQLSKSQRRRVQRYRQELRRQTDATISQQQQQQQSLPLSPIHLQSNTLIQQQAQLVASRFPVSMPTIPTLLGVPPPSVMTHPHQHGSASTTPLPSFIPVAMIPTTFFPSFFGSSMIQSSYMMASSSPLPQAGIVHSGPQMSIIRSSTPPLPPDSAPTTQSILSQSEAESESIASTPRDPSITPSQVSSTPVKILMDMASSRAPVSAISAPAATQPLPVLPTPIASLKCITQQPQHNITDHKSPSPDEEPFLVHPYEYAMRQTQLSWNTLDNPPPLPSSTANPLQSDRFASHLVELVLIPNSRISYMKQVTGRGHYISLWDMDVKEDARDIFNDIITTPATSSTESRQTRSSTTTSSSSSQTRAEHLQHVMPFDLPTHTQHAYQQTLTEQEHKHPPSFKSIRYKHISAYEKLIEAHDMVTTTMRQPNTISDIKWSPSHNVFAPSIALPSIHNPSLQQHIKSIAQQAQTAYQQRVKRLTFELLCDHVFTPPLDGFGIEGLQVYFKHGYSISWIHDELLWLAALNYMAKSSIGAALWIAIGLHDLKQKWDIIQISEWFVRVKPDLMQVGTLLDALCASGTRIEYVVQHPGELISSPPGIGACHIVIADGLFITQLAWNLSFNLPDAITCLSFWGETHTNRDFGHVHLDNGSMATRTVIPLYTMDQAGYAFNLIDKIDQYYHDLKILQTKMKLNIKVVDKNDDHLTYCKNCLYRQDWVRVNNRCIHCFFKESKVIRLLK